MAVFTEAELKSTKQVDVFTMLEGANYLTEDEVKVQPQLIPVKENSRLHGHTVRFEDIATLAESMDVDYISAMRAVAESNKLDYNHLCVVVKEEDIIIDPDICGQLKNIVVAPVSESDLAVQYTDAVVEAYLENQDDAFLEAGIMECAFLDEFVGLNEEEAAAPAAENSKIQNALQTAKTTLAQAATQSRQWIARQINRLRALYNGLLAKANADVKSGNAGMFKKAATKLANIIDKLMAKLHNAVNDTSTDAGIVSKAHANGLSANAHLRDYGTAYNKTIGRLKYKKPQK